MWYDRDLLRSSFASSLTLPFIVQRGVIHYGGTKGRESEVKRESVPSFAGWGRQLRQSGPPTLSGPSEDHRPSPASWDSCLVLFVCVMLHRSGGERATISTVE
jgi:hypothetical protein